MQEQPVSLTIIAGIVALGLLAYLFAALLKPERF
ncbi:MAG: K(+)-transporting ATPase subunit F [Armatimonadetes bacterium]|nr:K(+)-transporting ATPase subunit F [Armatimonadota bacterium]